MVPGPGLLLYPDQLLLHLELPGQVGAHLLNVPLELLEPLLVHLDPLSAVADRGVLQEGTKHHAETKGQVDIKSLHVGDFGKGTVNNHLASKLFEYLPPVDRAHQGDHCEHRGDPQPYPGGGGAPVQVEADPGHHHDQAAGNVDLDNGLYREGTNVKCAFRIGGL